MSISPRAIIRFIPLLALALVLPACTFKGSTKQTTDTTSNITGTTSGKSWFTDAGLVRQDQKVNAFIHLNFDNLKQDMAAGHGEYLASFGTLLGVAPDHQADFFALTQAHYTALIRSEQTTPEDMLVALNQLLTPYASSQLASVN